MNGGLILTRRVGESCLCTIDGKEMLVVVEKIDGNRVRLKFVADKSIKVIRTELTLGECE
jgi:carbon storage regulator CsrA